jgi:hypothetical protein
VIILSEASRVITRISEIRGGIVVYYGASVGSVTGNYVSGTIFLASNRIEVDNSYGTTVSCNRVSVLKHEDSSGLIFKDSFALSV